MGWNGNRNAKSVLDLWVYTEIPNEMGGWTLKSLINLWVDTETSKKIVGGH